MGTRARKHSKPAEPHLSSTQVFVLATPAFGNGQEDHIFCRGFCKKDIATGLAGCVALIFSSTVCAENSLSFGMWANYSYLPGDDEAKQWGDLGEEAFNFYADGAAEPGQGSWSYSAELRTGPGSFTDTDNNTGGNRYALHKAWLGWQLNGNHTVRLGKSQVPFGWKTYNFWPGDILLAGFGDQMDVGIKLSGKIEPWQYDLAYYLADDWGSHSTDTVDDNGHWGSSRTFRKIDTLVANIGYQLNGNHTIGLAAQSGKLEDLTENPGSGSDGSHRAAVIYYLAEFDNFFAKASWITMQRDLPVSYRDVQVKNTRLALELGYKLGNWTVYLDASAARPGSSGAGTDTVTAWAPGARVDYGPGWIYFEYLIQTGFVDRDGMVGEGHFDAVYLSMDFYF